MTTEDIRLEVTHGSRVLAAMGVLDAFGHVSARSPERTDSFFMSRRISAGEVTPADVYEHDFDGNGISEPNSKLFLERFIHGEIYRARPDVCAVVHSHSYSVLPFTVVPDSTLRPIAHVCGFLDGTKTAFDIADYEGDNSDLLVRTPELGQALAKHLGNTNVVLMRGHGFTAVGKSIQQAVYRAIYTEVNSRLQLDSMRLGEPRFLSSAEATACELTTNSQVDRVWEYWVSRNGYKGQ